jgi:hypothetical protein
MEIEYKKERSLSPSESMDIEEDEWSEGSDYEEPSELEFEEEEDIWEECNKKIRDMEDWEWKDAKKYKPTPMTHKKTISGEKTNFTVQSHPTEYWRLFFDETFMKALANYTNDHASIIRNDIRRKNKRKLWTNTSAEELELFIGMILAMGMVQKNSISSYWSTSTTLSTPGISQLMSYVRFRDLHNHISFRHKGANQANSGSLFRIQGVRDQIISISQAYYIPKKELCVDESMIAFKGRHQYKVYMPCKPVKFGFKAYLLCESESGYVLNWLLHTKQEEGEHGKLVQIMQFLTEPYLNEGFHVYMDRYYAHPKVFRFLQVNNCGVVGTVMLNRLSLPDKIKEEISQLKNKETLYFHYNGTMLLSVWKDIKVISVLSTIHGNSTVSVERFVRKKEGGIDGSKETVQKPIAIRDYNQHMRGVDLFDQIATYNSFLHKSKRWQIRIFCHFIEIVVSNAYILYCNVFEKANQKPTLDRYAFRLEIIRGLIENHRNQKYLPSFPLLKTKKIFPYVLKKRDCQLEKYSQKERKNCRICQVKGKRSQVSYFCSQCQHPVCPLCYDEHRRLMKSE